jgi:hypothetical protein
MRCCFCGTATQDGSEAYVEIEVTFPTNEGPQCQRFGAHVACFDDATADGFTVESPFD